MDYDDIDYELSSQKRYWIDLGCFSFFLVIILSMVATLMASASVAVEEMIERRRYKTRIVMQLAAWVAIMAVFREVILADFIHIILPP